MTTARYLVGDTRAVCAVLPDDSVDLVLTSPPFLALRSYLPADHPDKGAEVGTEQSPAEFLETLLDLTALWARPLAPHGSIAVELGDTYAGSGGPGGDYSVGGLRDGQGKATAPARRAGEWPLDKSLTGVPHLYWLSLAYGRNLLTGAPSPAGRWIVRNVVVWTRTNPGVGRLGDKYRPASSYITIATRAPDRWFDLDAVLEQRPGSDVVSPPLDWWTVSPESYTGSHYATWPRKLLDVPIRSLCPREVCTVCGEPRRRVVDSTRTFDDVTEGAGRARMRTVGAGPMGSSYTVTRTTLGWSDCGHSSYRPGVVLDPFGGSGTTAAVASGHSRDSVSIDLDERNVELARQRVGMFLEVDLNPSAESQPVVEGRPPFEPIAQPLVEGELEAAAGVAELAARLLEGVDDDAAPRLFS